MSTTEIKSTLPNEILEEISKWEAFITSTEDHPLLDFNEFDTSLLRFAPVRDAIMFTALGPDDYVYDHNTPCNPRDFPSEIKVDRISRATALLDFITAHGDTTQETADYARSILAYFFWSVQLYDTAQGLVDAVVTPTRLSSLVGSALAVGLPGHFTMSV